MSGIVSLSVPAPRRSRLRVPPVVTQRCWEDAELDALADRLERREDPAERAGAALAAMARARRDPERRELVCAAAAIRLQDAVPAVRARALLTGSDPAADADARALHARILVEIAWSSRRAARGEAARRAVYETYRGILQEADALAASALKREPAHPAAAVARIVTARGLRLDLPEQWNRFAVARRSRSTLFGAHLQMLQNVSGGWSGDHETMLDLARSVARSAPPGDPVGAVLPLAWATLDLAGEDGRGFGADRDGDVEVAAASAQRWLGAGEAALAHPYAVVADNLYGWFLGARSGGHAHLARTGGRMGQWPWQDQLFAKRTYRRALRAALADTDAAGRGVG